MGQGTESCGGYEMDYDPYDFRESDGYSIWTGKDGKEYKVKDMSNPHIESCIELCQRASLTSNFECDSDKWEEWVDIFYYILSERRRLGIYIPRKLSKGREKIPRKNADTWRGRPENLSMNKTKPENSAQGSKILLVCWCGEPYQARFADLKRGWALSCCKSCAAIKRDFGRKDPVCSVTGKTYKELIK